MRWKATIEDLERRVARLEEESAVTHQRVGALVGRVGLRPGWSDVAEATADGGSDHERLVGYWDEQKAKVSRALADAAEEIERALGCHGEDHGKTLGELVADLVKELEREKDLAERYKRKAEGWHNAAQAITKERDAETREAAKLKDAIAEYEGDRLGDEHEIALLRSALAEAKGELLVARQKHERTVEALNRRRDEAKAAKAELARLRDSLTALVQPRLDETLAELEWMRTELSARVQQRDPLDDVVRCERCGDPLDRPTGSSLCSACVGQLVGVGR